jgi:hypothetical protein
MIKNLLREALTENTYLTEIDFKDAFKDVKATCLSPDMVVNMLNDELARLNHNKEAKEKDKVKRGKKDIIVTRGNIEQLQDKSGNINIDMFIKNLTAEPDTIFDHNPKMEKSDEGRPQITVNTGLPAIKGIVYDMDKKEFLSLNTCPSAGICQMDCYARKAFYVMDDTKTMKLTRRLNFLLNNPDGYKAKILSELEPIAQNLKRTSVGKAEKMRLLIRWNDAGDFFGDMYLKIAKDVTKELISKGYNVMSYAYTKIGKYVIALDKDKNFIVNFSTGAKISDVNAVDAYDVKSSIKKSHTVPLEKFSGIFVKKGAHYVKGADGKPLFVDETSPEKLKNDIYRLYGPMFKITRESLRFTYELPQKEGKKNQFNVIVLPSGDSDIGAQRNDVKISFLLEH